MPASSSKRTKGSDGDNDVGGQGITHTRTVTVEDAQVMDSLHGTTAHASYGPVQFQNIGYERSPSPSGSDDPILNNQGRGVKNKTEVSVGLQELMSDQDDHEKDMEIERLPPGWVRDR